MSNTLLDSRDSDVKYIYHVVMEMMCTHASCFGSWDSAMDRFILYLLISKKFVLDCKLGQVRRLAKNDRGGVGEIYFSI